MKKIFALLLVLLLLLPSIIACGKEKEDDDDDDVSTTTTTTSTTQSTTQSSNNGSGTTDTSNNTTGSSEVTPDSGNTDVSGTEDSNDPTTGSTTGSAGSTDSTNGSTGSSDTSAPTDSTNGGTDTSTGTTDSTGGTTGSTNGTTGSSTGATSSSKPITPPNPDDYEDVEIPPDTVTKWNGKTLNILATTWNDETPSAPWSQVELTVDADDWYSDDNFGVLINSAVLTRAEFIKKTYGVELNWINARGNQISNKLSEAVVGGSADTRYHIAMPRMMEAQSIVTTNSIYKVSDQRYITLSKSYYNQASIEAYSAYGNTLFVAGDFSFLDEQTSYMIYYNVALTKGFESFPNLYQMVKDGTWTVDTMINVAKLLSKNEGDAAWTDDDVYGYGTTNMSRFFQYSGIQQVTVLDNEFVITLDSPKITTLITKINTITSSEWARTNWDGGFGSLQKAFEEGRLLFYDEVVQKTDYFNEQTENFKTGVLPTPKLTEDQYSYLTPCAYQSVVMCIPKATSDREMSNYFFEILSYTGQKYVMKAYYDNIRTKLDPETASDSMQIIKDYIFAGLCYDQGYMYGWNGLLNGVQNESYANGKNNFRQVYQAAIEDATAQVDDWNLAWLDYTDTIE